MTKHRSAVARDLYTPKYRKRIVPNKRRDPSYDTLDEYHDYRDGIDRLLEEYEDERDL